MGGKGVLHCGVPRLDDFVESELVEKWKMKTEK